MKGVRASSCEFAEVASPSRLSLNMPSIPYTHTCLVCGEPRSHDFHKRHSSDKAVKGICRRCRIGGAQINLHIHHHHWYAPPDSTQARATNCPWSHSAFNTCTEKNGSVAFVELEGKSNSHQGDKKAHELPARCSRTHTDIYQSTTNTAETRRFHTDPGQRPPVGPKPVFLF